MKNIVLRQFRLLAILIISIPASLHAIDLTKPFQVGVDVDENTVKAAESRANAKDDSPTQDDSSRRKRLRIEMQNEQRSLEKQEEKRLLLEMQSPASKEPKK